MAKTTEEAETTIFTNFVDIFGKKNVIELQLNIDVVESLFDGDDAVITPVYIQAKTPHQARLALGRMLIETATRMGQKRIGQLATEVLSRQQEEVE